MFDPQNHRQEHLNSHVNKIEKGKNKLNKRIGRYTISTASSKKNKQKSLWATNLALTKKFLKINRAYLPSHPILPYPPPHTDTESSQSIQFQKTSNKNYFYL